MKRRVILDTWSEVLLAYCAIFQYFTSNPNYNPEKISYITNFFNPEDERDCSDGFLISTNIYILLSDLEHYLDLLSKSLVKSGSTIREFTSLDFFNFAIDCLEEMFGSLPLSNSSKSDSVLYASVAEGKLRYCEESASSENDHINLTIEELVNQFNNKYCGGNN